MTYILGRGAASSLLTAALSMRLFVEMTVDFPRALNSSWLCPIVGFLIYLPLAFCIMQASKLNSGSSWENITNGLPKGFVFAAEFMFALFLLLDASSSVRLTASSSNLIALKDITVHLLIVPLAFVVAAVVIMGGDAAGNSARIWLKCLPILLIIMVVVQVRGYRPGWINPLLGSGIGEILEGGIRCAGDMALLSLMWMIALPDRHKGGIMRYCAVSAAAASILLLLQSMSHPAMIGLQLTQAARIELLLSNGRMTLSPQLLLDVLWYGGLLYLIAAEAVCAACFLHRCFPRVSIKVIAVIETAVVTAAAIKGPATLWIADRIKCLHFIIIGITVAFAMLGSYSYWRHDKDG